ncbi:MAG TPA: DUF6502 family protein [Candidatus Acidoferrales bacterium]|nr:DUF6502 family protein [Candidatus Acidoferrales bacterium]
MARTIPEPLLAAAPPETLLAAIRRVLKPLARLLISRSLPYPFISNLLRAVYVQVAVEEFPVEGRPQTDSRITLLTGVHRKDVKRLRAERHPGLRPPRAASLGSQLIARWTTLPEFLDSHRKPKALPRVATAKNEPCFESLVRSINTDIRPRVVLDEWLRLGIAHLDDNDRVCLNVEAFVPREGSDEMAYYFGRNLHDHVAAAVHNMLGEPTPLLERSVSYNNLTPEAVAELHELARRRGMDVLKELNARAMTLQQLDSGKSDASHRMNFGLYFFRENESSSDEDGDEED